MNYLMNYLERVLLFLMKTKDRSMNQRFDYKETLKLVPYYYEYEESHLVAGLPYYCLQRRLFETSQ